MSKFGYDTLFRTGQNKRVIKDSTRDLLAYYSDPKRKDRKSKGECKFCFYYASARIGGSAITKYNCKNCNKEQTYGNTCVDKYCIDCAKQLKICKHCGAKMD